MRGSTITVGLLLTAVISLSGCVGALVATTAVVAGQAATDTRTLGNQLDDCTLKIRILKALRSDEHIQRDTHYQLIIHNGVVVLLGQAPSAALRKQIEKAVKAIPGVAAVHNEIRQSPIITAKKIAHDSWIASKIRSQLLVNKKIQINHVKIAVEAGEVLLYGSVVREEAEDAVTIARYTQGVERVLQAFQYLDEDPKADRS